MNGRGALGKNEIFGVEKLRSFSIEFVTQAKIFSQETSDQNIQNASGPDDDSDPFFSEGPEVIHSTGWQVYWKNRNSVTVKRIKQQKYEGHGNVVLTSRKVFSCSFPSYFSPFASPEGGVVDVPICYQLGFFLSVNVWSQNLYYYSSLKKQLNTSMKTLRKRPKMLKVRKEKRSLTKNKKDPKRMWTQQRMRLEISGICVQLLISPNHSWHLPVTDSFIFIFFILLIN